VHLKITLSLRQQNISSLTGNNAVLADQYPNRDREKAMATILKPPFIR